MTPAEHLAEAERLLARAIENGESGWVDEAHAYVQESIAHALIAAAAEMGVPHAPEPAGGPGASTG